MRIQLILFFMFIRLLPTIANDQKKYSFSTIDYRQGLSNSAVLCFFKDNQGLMWMGTYDGVNCWDGKNMEVLRTDFSTHQTLNNNIIRTIQQADNDCLWVTTFLGGTRLSRSNRKANDNFEFSGVFYLHSNQKGNTWVVDEKGIYYYNTQYQKFIRIGQPLDQIEKMKNRCFVNDDGKLWYFPAQTGKLHKLSLPTFQGDTLSVNYTTDISDFHFKPIEQMFYQNGVICFIDCDSDLYVYDIARKSKIYICHLSSLIQQYGDIKNIVLFEEDIMLGFRMNGLVRLRASQRYEAEVLDRNIRVYDLYSDNRQGILWIASDGQGAVMYFRKYAIANNLMLGDLSANLSRQVRSIMTDSLGGLWMGTKGDGLIHILDYQNEKSATEVYSPQRRQMVENYTKCDREFHVYKLKESRYDKGFWIASGMPGLYFYSFANHQLYPVEDESGEKDVLNNLHDIYEESDSVLYVVSSEHGFHRLSIERRGNKALIRSRKHYKFFNRQREIQSFYPLLPEGDSILWLGSREQGLVRFDKRTEDYFVFSLKDLLQKSVDDVLSLCLAKDGRLYVGTTSGLVILSEDRQLHIDYVGREQGLLNDMIHGVLEDEDGFIWLSTNRGLIKYNPTNKTSHSYYYNANVQIGEFSDDAYYRCPYTGRLFFGGINGVLYLDGKVATLPAHYPDILLRSLHIGKKQVDLYHYIQENGGTLRLKGSENLFSISFVAPDYLAGEDIEYSYMLKGYDEDWSPFSRESEASYMDVPAGTYTFQVRYKKDVFNTEYKHFSLPVQIQSNWYCTPLAYFCYFVLTLGLAGYLLWLFRSNLRQKRMLNKLLSAEQRKTSPDYTHTQEANSSFARLYYLSNQLRAENLSTEQRLEIAGKIREITQSELLNPAFLEHHQLKEFLPERFFSTARMNIQEMSGTLIHLMTQQTGKAVAIQNRIPKDFTYPVYTHALYALFYYCYYLIWSSEETTEYVVETVENDNGQMVLSFIGPHSIGQRLYSTLSDVTSEPGSPHLPETGLRLLQQFVRVALEHTGTKVHYTQKKEEQGEISFVLPPAPLKENVASKCDKKTILLLEDKDEMAWLIDRLLEEEYTVIRVRNIQAAAEEASRSNPVLLLIDMNMYIGAEETLMAYLRKNQSQFANSLFVPLLTWKAESTILRKLLLQSDAHLTLPYDILFLREIIHNAIYGKHEAKQVYIENMESLSGVFSCTTEEQAELARKLIWFIDQNISHEDLGVSLIAEHLMMSTRQFYRKYSEIASVSLRDLIKCYRLEKALILLQESDLSVQEIIADIGISSRSYFYREFTRRFGVPPQKYREQLNADQDGEDDSPATEQ